MSTDGLTFLALAAAVEESGGGFLSCRLLNNKRNFGPCFLSGFSSGYGSLSGLLHTDACCWQR